MQNDLPNRLFIRWNMSRCAIAPDRDPSAISHRFRLRRSRRQLWRVAQSGRCHIPGGCRQKNVAVRGQMDPEALPRPAAEASEDDGLEKAPQVALDAANMDGLYFHGHVFFFEVNYHLVQAAIVLPYRCVEVGREPYDALAGRRKKDGLLGNVKKCSALQ